MKKLKGIREQGKSGITGKDMVLYLLSFFIFGVLSGVAAKYSDTIPTNENFGIFFDFISNLTTRLGIWVFMATLFAAWSNSPLAAAIKVFAFFAGMLSAYYIYSQVLFGFFPTYYFLRWGGISLASPFAAYMVWFGRGKGWAAAFIAGLPIGLLLEQGYPFFYLFSAVPGFNAAAAVMLLILLPAEKDQYVKVAAMGVLTSFILRQTDLLSYLIGGL